MSNTTDKMVYDIVVYHSQCPDGIASAWAVKLIHPQIDIMPCSAGKPPQKELEYFKDKRVVFVDLCPSVEYFCQLINVVGHLTIIDHHKPNYEKLNEHVDSDAVEYRNLECVFENDKSGCMLTWDYFHTTQRPWFIEYIGDRDLWTWKLPSSREVNNAFFDGGHVTFDGLQKLYENTDSELINKFIKKGEEIAEFKNTLIDNTIKHYSIPCKYKRMINGIEKEYNVWLYTGRADLISDVGNKLMGKKLTMTGGLIPDFTVYWSYNTTTKEYGISMRSTDQSTNVNEICQLYGGGGHRNSSGCTLSGNIILEDIFVPIWCIE